MDTPTPLRDILYAPMPHVYQQRVEQQRVAQRQAEQNFHNAQAAKEAEKAKATKDAKDAKYSKEAHSIVAYTDGACSGNPGPAGLGVVLLINDQTLELSEYLGQGTNNIAELTAIQRAAEAILQHISANAAPATTRVRMHTDSTYAIGVLSKGWKAKANVALIQTIKSTIHKLPQLELVHVRAHAGIALNERADALAVQAVRQRHSTGWVYGR